MRGYKGSKSQGQRIKWVQSYTFSLFFIANGLGNKAPNNVHITIEILLYFAITLLFPYVYKNDINGINEIGIQLVEVNNLTEMLTVNI